MEGLYPSIEITNIPKVLSNIKMEINQLDILSQKHQTYQQMEITYQERIQQKHQMVEDFLTPFRIQTKENIKYLKLLKLYLQEEFHRS